MIWCGSDSRERQTSHGFHHTLRKIVLNKNHDKHSNEKNMQKQCPSIKEDKERQTKKQEIKKNEWKHLHCCKKPMDWPTMRLNLMSQSSLFLLCPVFHSSYIWSPWLTSVPKHDCLNRNLRNQREEETENFSLLTRVLVVIEVRISTESESKACWDGGWSPVTF